MGIHYLYISRKKGPSPFVVFFLKNVNSYIYLVISGLRERQDRERFSFLSQGPEVCNSQDCAGLRLGAANSIQVSHWVAETSPLPAWICKLTDS